MIEQLKQSLQVRQLTLPDHELDMIISMINGADECLTANYDASTIEKIKLYSGIIIAVNSAMIFVSSQHAPSGASRSFTQIEKGIVTTYEMLRNLDPHGCMSDIVTAPSGVDTFFAMTVNGGRR